ncbi:hypothetical protein KFE25_002220 [Diacronema lutheri]|uniref:Ataxin-10 domain-containing protein n=2 Tax=Diacronema lutheri TaxID=2081491 RepID=A0A8J6CBD7_DIALT|nr:hypothetical protein KFE25_002220 [Diacronema lutheri]
MDAIADSLRHAVRASRECDPAVRTSLCTADVLDGCRCLIRLRDAPLRSAWPLALDALRLLRNLCARAPDVQARLLDEGVIDEVFGLLAWARAQPDRLASPAECALAARLCVQVVANALVGNARAQSYVWAAHFPRLIGELVGDADASVQSCACMCLFTCVRDDPSRQRALALSADALRPLARSAAGVVAARRRTAGGGGATVSSDARSRCPRESELEYSWALATVDLLLRSAELAALALATVGLTAGRDVRGTRGDGGAQGEEREPAAACLLDALDYLLEADEGAGGGAGRALDGTTSRLGTELAALLDALCDWDEAQYARALLDVRAAEPLLLARAIARVLGTAAAQRSDAVGAAAHAHGLVGGAAALLARLLAWAPLVLAKDGPVRLSTPSVAHGLKSTFVRFVANATYGDRRAQRALREGGALGTLLCCCRDDDENPQLREWALFAVRNAADACSENQAALAQIERAPRAVANARELEAAGMEVRVDRLSGKLRVHPRGAPVAAPIGDVPAATPPDARGGGGDGRTPSARAPASAELARERVRTPREPAAAFVEPAPTGATARLLRGAMCAAISAAAVSALAARARGGV